MSVLENINLYIEKTVQVTTKDGRMFSGVLDLINDRVYIDSFDIGLDEVEDIRYCGRLNLDTYDLKGGKLYTQKENFLLIEEELIREIGSDYAYGEKIVEFTSHLVVDTEGNRICICDLQATRITHAVNIPVLQSKPHLYRIDNGPYFYAVLEDDQLQTVDGTIPFDTERITDITCCPEAGVELTVILQDGRSIPSTVASASPRGLVLTQGYMGRIPYDQIRDLRYEGEMNTRLNSAGRSTKYCGDYMFRFRYLRPDSKPAYTVVQKGSFSVGMNSRGLIARDVDLASYDTRGQGYGVLCEYYNVQAKGAVSDRYENGEKAGRDYHLSAARLPKELSNSDIDTQLHLYVVRFWYSTNADYDKPTVTAMELLKVFNRNEYHTVTVDQQGNIDAVPYDTPRDTSHIVEGYGFLTYFAKRMERYGEGMVSTRFEPTKIQNEYYVYMPLGMAKFKGQPVDTRKYIYLVRFRAVKQETGGAGRLPAIYKMEILSAHRRNQTYSVNERGEVSSYDDDQLSLLKLLIGKRVVVVCRDTNRYLGYVHHNDRERSVLTLISEERRENSIPYANIEQIVCLGTVKNYREGYYGFIDMGSGTVHFYDNDVHSNAEPKLQVGETVCFHFEQDGFGNTHARQVQPVTETEETGYVVAQRGIGFFEVLSEEAYAATPRMLAKSTYLRLQDPTIEFADTQHKDYRVRSRSIQINGAAPLIYGIEQCLQELPKLHLGYVEKFCADNDGNFTYGFVVPLQPADENGQPPATLYFHASQNRNVKDIVQDGENPNRTELWLVSYQLGTDPVKKNACAVNMNFISRHPKSYFKQMAQSVAQVEPIQIQRQIQTVFRSIQSQIHTCLAQNNVAGAKKLLEDHRTESGCSEEFYYQQLHNILMKEYKLDHSQQVRLQWLDCIIRLRRYADVTEQYGQRLDLLFKHATLLSEEGRQDEARELFAEWKKVLDEYCIIYPSKRSGYKLMLTRINNMIGATPGSRNAVELGGSDGSHTGKQFHDYIEWRLDTTNVYNLKAEGVEAGWVAAKTALQQDEEDGYLEQLKQAVTAEKLQTRKDNHRRKAHFAFLLMHLASDCDEDQLSEYFADALQKDSTFAAVLGGTPAGEINDEAKSCSQFTLDSVLLFACTELDPQGWLPRFADAGLRRRYIRELQLLLRKNTGDTDRYDMEQLDTLFDEAVAAVRKPVDAEKYINKYAEAVQRRMDIYSHCGVTVPFEIRKVLRDLQGYGSREGFSARMSCLMDNGTELQKYHRSIQKTPTVHSWNLIWPLCASLIGQIRRAWCSLCQNSVPSIEFGTVRAEREPDGEWKVTVPIRNRKGAQKALDVRIQVFNTDCDTLHELVGDGRDNECAVYVRPADPMATQITLTLNVTYQYYSDIQFKGDKYQLIKQKGMISREFSVSCFAGQRQELSLDILNSFGYDAKANIDITTPAGKAVAEILKNRTEEIETVIGAISIGEKGSRRLLRDGRWVALYGQWRVGKTTILHEVHRALQGEEFGEQAVTAYTRFGNESDFEMDTVDNIRVALESVQDMQLAQLWMDIVDDWEEKNGDVTTLKTLSRLLGRFHQRIAPKTVVLALDEFTNIYYAIKKGYVSNDFLRSFIDFIGRSGFVVLTAGGEHTVSLMMDYDVNMMQKADCKLEVKYLSRADTAKYVETVITVPSYFGSEEQKAGTLERIFELTQGNAFLLHKFCEALIRYVRENKTLVTIDGLTILRTLDRIAASEPTRPQSVIKDYFNSLFNPLNEKEESDGDYGGVKDMNLRILKGIVRHAFPETHSCLKKDLAEDFAEDENFENYLNMLIARAVVTEDSGNLSIPIDLYYEIQSRIERKEDSHAV